MTGLALAGVAYAEANWGRWVARCPRPLCANAVQIATGQPDFACVGPGGCGLSAEVVWPADPEAIEVLLSMRPVERTRNWLPGESLEDLLRENAAHDLVPPQWEALADANGGVLPLMQVQNGRVVGGILHHELVAAGRREIGA